MTPTEQRIAIAEACGEDIPRLSACCAASSEMDEYDICPVCHDHTVFEPDAESLPDYLTDLNAMHEAERGLPHEGIKRIYVDHLVCLMKPGEFTVMAPAAQRAEAFLRTLGLWKEAA